VVPTARPANGQELVEHHYEFIWRLLRRMGLSPTDADDATQQVFMVTLHPEPKQIQPGSERSFLYGVALNVCREFRRKHASGARHDASQLDVQVAPNSPLRELEARQAWQHLQQVLSVMSEEVRSVFVLFELEGLTAAEIAELMDVPAGTVASRLRRGRELFHEHAAALRAALPEGAA
jgi:RNA polymerase sigma-70 factor, ECF subfamily